MRRARTLATTIIDAVADALCVVPEWVPRGVIVLFLALVAWLPIGAAWLILASIGGLR